MATNKTEPSTDAVSVIKSSVSPSRPRNRPASYTAKGSLYDSYAAAVWFKPPPARKLSPRWRAGPAHKKIRNRAPEGERRLRTIKKEGEGASCRIRTNDPEITNHVLWPTELKRQVGKLYCIAPLQPSTLAAVKPWGNSEGAGRAGLSRRKYTPIRKSPKSERRFGFSHRGFSSTFAL